MTDANDLLRALARRLESQLPLSSKVRDDDEAVCVFVEVAHGGSCPGCGGPDWSPSPPRHILCPRCGLVSAYRGSALGRRRLRIHDLLAAVFAIFVDSSTTSARGFSRQHELRLETAWRLLHDVRNALPRATAQEASLRGVVLGACAPTNKAAALFSSDSDGRRIVAVDADEGGPPGTPRPELAFWLGRLRAWLTDIFRGVSAKHLWRYLAEFAARHGRVGRKGQSHI
jgi:hypothetical protein